MYTQRRHKDADAKKSPLQSESEKSLQIIQAYHMANKKQGKLINRSLAAMENALDDLVIFKGKTKI